MTYRRIVVPLDGSRTAVRGLREAIRLAGELGARLRLVHVVDESALLGAAEAGIDPAPLLHSLGKGGQALLQRASAPSSAQVCAATLRSTRRWAARPRAILGDARKWRADLIVMGTHGRRGVRRMVLGSDAEQVVRQSTVPVLLVRARDD